MDARFVLSKKKLIEQVRVLKGLGLKVSYSYKTNREVGKVLQDISDVDFSIHAREEIEDIKDSGRIWFFTQAESLEELSELLGLGIRNFVVDNEIDLGRILEIVGWEKTRINLSLRMKFKEHRIGSGKYFVYGMDSEKVCRLVEKICKNEFIGRLGIHIHRKSQNTSEWGIKEEIEDSLKNVIDKINFVNFGGGLPIKYRSYSGSVFDYISEKIKEAVDWLKNLGIESYIEPGRFLAGPAVKLECGIVQIYDRTIVVNTTIYNCALDSVLTNTKMLVKGELDSDSSEGCDYLIKGNSPTRDDIFRYKVRLLNPNVDDKIVFLNAGAYNYTTDFFGFKKLETCVVEDFEDKEDNPPPHPNSIDIRNLQNDKLGNQSRERSQSSKNLSDTNRLAERPSEAGCGASNVRVVAIPTFQGCLGKNKGCEKAPGKILKGYEHDVANINNEDFVKMMHQLEELSGDIFVGGDHSITYGLFKGFVNQKENQDKRVGLIVFDAHPDCVNNFSPPTHEDFIKVLIEEGVVDAENVLLVGLRKFDDIEKKFLDEKGVKYVCFGSEVEMVLKDFVTQIDQIYLSVDIDVLNSSYAPGTGYVEEGGFSLEELVRYLDKIVDSGKVGRSDLVEVNPDLDVEGRTVESAREVLKVLN